MSFDNFLNILLVAITALSASHAEEQSSLFLLKKKGFRLGNGLLRSVSAENDITCANYCALENSKCKSFNFIADGTLAENCELNSKLATADGANLVRLSEAIYYENIYAELPPTCSALKVNEPETPSGYYKIRPKKDDAPFTVFCNMTDKNKIGVTVFGHDSEEKTHVNNHEGRGEYRKIVKYNDVTVEQIENVINASHSCEQFIKYDCKGSAIYFQSSAGASAWWVSRQGYNMTYWGGATPESHSCACAMTKSCYNANKLCNCDSVSHIWVADSGFLVDKQYLPVIELRFGDTGHETEEGYHTLGKLLCWD